MLLALPVAAAAGLVSFLSPCVLPLVPGYLSFVTGLAGVDAAAATQQPATAAERAREAGLTTELGRTALVLALVGYLAGLVHDDPTYGGSGECSTLLPFAVGGLAAAGAVTAFTAGGPAARRPAHHGVRVADRAARHDGLLCAPDPVRRAGGRSARPMRRPGPLSPQDLRLDR